MIVRRQSDMINTKESVLVCDKPYHTNKSKVHKEEKIAVFRNCAYSAADLSHSSGSHEIIILLSRESVLHARPFEFYFLHYTTQGASKFC